MSKVTSKLQVTVPKALAAELGLRPGDEIDWIASGDALRVLPSRNRRSAMDTTTRLRQFDQATARQRRRQSKMQVKSSPRSRGWSREDVYVRRRPR